MTCALCGNATKLFPKKISDGVICQECEKQFSLYTDFSSETTERLLLRKTVNEQLSNVFITTNKYGELFLDGVNGLFCISPKEKDGEPVYRGDIYRISDLKGVSLSCANPKNIGKEKDKIVCDIEFSFRTDAIAIHHIIKKQVSCESEITRDRKLIWKEPGEYLIFRKIFEGFLCDTMNAFLKKAYELYEKMEMERKMI